MEKHCDQFDPRVYITPVMDMLINDMIIEDRDINDIVMCIKKGVREIVGILIVEFGSYGMANKISTVSTQEMARTYKMK